MLCTRWGKFRCWCRVHLGDIPRRPPAQALLGPRSLPPVLSCCLQCRAPSTASATHLTDTGSPEGPTVPWGFNEFWGFSPDGTWNAEQADHEIELANAIMPRALSAHRFFVQWRRVVFTPKPPNEYDWSVTDRAYQTMRGAEPERKPVMVIHDAPDWARDPTATCPVAACTFPPDPDHYDDWQQTSRMPSLGIRMCARSRSGTSRTGPVLGPGPGGPGRCYVEVLALAHDAVTAAGARAGHHRRAVAGHKHERDPHLVA